MNKEQGHVRSRYNIYYRYYSSTNKRATIVCIHGILSDSRLFDSFSAALADKGFDIYSIDLPGYGLSNVKIDDINFDDVLASIHDFITSINCKPFLLGFSLGSIYATYYASKYTDISGLILASPMLHPIESMLPEYALFIHKSYQENPKGRINLLKFLEVSKKKYDYIANNPLCVKEYPLAYLYDMCLKALDKEVLKKITLPVLILYGKHDKFIHIIQVEEMYKLLASKDKMLKILDTDHWLDDTFFYNGNKDTEIIRIIERWLNDRTKYNLFATILPLSLFLML